MQKVCFNCGKNLGEQEPYENKQTLVDVCKSCRVTLEKANKEKRVRTEKYMLQGGGITL